MNAQCASCRQFKVADGFTTCSKCRDRRDTAVLGVDSWGVKRDPERDAALKAEMDAIRDAERSVDLNLRVGATALDPQVDPFVAGRHDLQPRPFKRRWWSKRR